MARVEIEIHWAQGTSIASAEAGGLGQGRDRGTFGSRYLYRELEGLGQGRETVGTKQLLLVHNVLNSNLDRQQTNVYIYDVIYW